MRIAGSYALLGTTVSRESTVVSKLRAAGAVILGKATMGEWAQMRSRRASSSHGWSAYGGQALGAYYPQQDPSGSSSGSAVAASIGLALAALATETSGSIVLPAEHSNVVGIKPTIGLTSRSMVIPISMRQDTVGPVARTVKDAAYILTAVFGKDKHDNWTSAQPFDELPNYVEACRYEAFKGAHLGIPRNGIAPFLNRSTEPIMAAFEVAVKLIRAAGATIVDDANFASFDIDAISRNASMVLGTDFVAQVPGYLSQLTKNPNHVKNLRDIADFTRSDLREEYPDRDVCTKSSPSKLQISPYLPSQIYVWDRELERNYTNDSEESYNAYQANLEMAGPLGVLGTLDRYNLDALVMPTFTSFHLPAIAGLPIVTVPLGFYPANTPLEMNLKRTMVNVAPNIPFGIAFVGRRWSEETLIGLAFAFEQRTRVREKMRPYISPTFELGDQISRLDHVDPESAIPVRVQSPDPNYNDGLTLSESMQSILRRGVNSILSTGSNWTLAFFGSVASAV